MIKTAYSIFKNNMSSGLTIEANAKIDSNVTDIITPSQNEGTTNEDPTIPGID